MARRALLDQFQLPNVAYIGCSVTFYVADATGAATAVKATLYDDLTGSGTLLNPQNFNSEGALAQPTYIESAVVPVVAGAHVVSQTLGVVCPPGGARGDWTTATIYLPGDIVTDGAAGTGTGDIYAVVNFHQSGTWATDAANANKLKLVLDASALSLAPDATESTKGKAELANIAETRAGSDASRTVHPDGLASLWQKGSDITAASTLTQPSDANKGGYHAVTGGATTINLMWSGEANGCELTLRYDAAHTLAHNTGSAGGMRIPGSANITVDNGTVIKWRFETATNTWRFMYGRKSDGSSLFTAGSDSYRALAIGGTVVSTDRRGIVDFTTAGVTCAFTAAATLGAGFTVTIYNSAASGDVTLDPNSSETLDGQTTRLLRPGDKVTLVCTGSAWKTVAGRYSYQASGQTVTLGGDLSLTHGLGVEPEDVIAKLVCVTADGSHATGDKIIADALVSNSASQGVNIRPSATTIVINQSAAIYVLDKTGHTFVAITAAKWQWEVKAWAR